MQAGGVRGQNVMKLIQKILISKDSLPPTVEESPKHFPRRQERRRGKKHIWTRGKDSQIKIKTGRLYTSDNSRTSARRADSSRHSWR